MGRLPRAVSSRRGKYSTTPSERTRFAHGWQIPPACAILTLTVLAWPLWESPPTPTRSARHAGDAAIILLMMHREESATVAANRIDTLTVWKRHQRAGAQGSRGEMPQTRGRQSGEMPAPSGKPNREILTGADAARFGQTEPRCGCARFLSVGRLVE